MGIFGFKTQKEKQQQIELAAKQQAFEKVLAVLEQKAATFGSNNEWARQVYSQFLSKGIGAISYDLARYVNEGYIKNPHVYSVINKIIQPISTVPWLVYQATDKKNFNRYLAYKSEGKIDEAELYARKSLDIVENTPFNKVFEEECNETQSWNDFVEEAAGYYELTGNNYIYGLPPAGLKYFTKLYNLPSQVTEIITGTWQQPVMGYRVAYGNNYTRTIDPQNVIHRKRFNPTDMWGANHDSMLYGLSPLAPLCRTVKRSNEGIDAMLGLIMNGFPPGVLYEDYGEFGNPMSPEENKELDEKFKARFGGGHNANKFIKANTKLGWLQMGLKSADMELLEADQLDVKTVATAYNVAIPLVSNDGNSIFGSDVNAAEKYTWQNARIPALTNLRDNLNRYWVKQYNLANNTNLWIDFDTKAIPAMQEDRGKKSEMHLKELRTGVINANTYRAFMDMEVDESNPLLNQYMLETNLKYIDVDKIPEKYKTFISVINSMSPLVANQVIASMTDTELRELVAIGALPAGEETIRDAGSFQTPPTTTTV